jgi:hypothetical protein
MPSSIEKKRNARLSAGDSLPPSYSHVAVAILIPSAFSLAFTAMAADALPGYLPLGAFGILAPCLMAAVSAVSSLVLERDRSSALAFVRGFILSLILIWTLQALLLPRPGGIRFLPDPRGVFLTAVCAFSFLLARKFRSAFRSREILLNAVEGPDGVRLQIAMRDESLMVSSAIREMKSSLTVSAVVIVVQGAVLLVIFLATGRLSLLPTLSFSLSIAAAAVLRTTVADYLRFQDLLSLGLRDSTAKRAARIRLGFIAVPCLAIFSFLASSDRSILPIKWIVDFLNYLFSLIHFEIKIPPMGEMGPPMEFEMLSRIDDIAGPTAEPWIDIRLILELIGKALIAAAAAAFLAFMLSPIFTKRVVPFLSALRPLKALAALLAFLKRSLSLLFSGRATTPAMSLAQKKRVEQSFEAITKKKKDPQKAKEIGKMAKAFVALIERGAELGLPYLPSSLPLEWAMRLSEKWPTEGSQLALAAEIFEEALYSDKLVSRDRVELYFSVMKRAGIGWG